MTTTYRVLVSTDLGGGDPDDIQSLFRLLHYSDILRLEGLVSSPGPGHGKGYRETPAHPSAEAIRHWVTRVDLDHLRSRGHTGLMSEAEVLGIVKQGARQPIAPGPGRSTEGSDWIVRCARQPDPLGLDRPLWVLVWGCASDLAQALHDAPDIAERIRVYLIGSTNTVADVESRDFIFDGMRDRWPGLWWIENGVLPHMSRDTMRGVYQGGEQGGEWGNIAFIERNIRGRGSTHNGLFAERCGDAFPVATWPQGALKEGDTPTFLYLLSPVLGGVGDVDDPTRESWGGRFHRPDPQRYPNYFCDLDADPPTCQATISKWRVAYMSDWKQRWGWYGD